VDPVGIDPVATSDGVDDIPEILDFTAAATDLMNGYTTMKPYRSASSSNRVMVCMSTWSWLQPCRTMTSGRRSCRSYDGGT
jgi:hypothetical protein